jgi:hypothetical protein
VKVFDSLLSAGSRRYFEALLLVELAELFSEAIMIFDN